MLYRIYTFAHDVGIHFWDIPSILVLVLIAVIGIVHTVRQKQREEDFEDELDSRQRHAQQGR